MASQRYTTLPSFYRGDTPLFVVPVSLASGAYDFSSWTGYFTMTTNQNPTSNSDAKIHKVMSYSPNNTLGLVDQNGNQITNYFYYQLTNSDTETLDPTATYYWDVQINKAPTSTNNFTLQTGKFTPYIDYSRGLS